MAGSHDTRFLLQSRGLIHYESALPKCTDWVIKTGGIVCEWTTTFPCTVLVSIFLPCLFVSAVFLLLFFFFFQVTKFFKSPNLVMASLTVSWTFLCVRFVSSYTVIWPPSPSSGVILSSILPLNWPPHLKISQLSSKFSKCSCFRNSPTTMPKEKMRKGMFGAKALSISPPATITPLKTVTGRAPKCSTLALQMGPERKRHTHSETMLMWQSRKEG